MFVREKKYLQLVRAFNAKVDELKYSEKQLDALISDNNSLKRELYNKEKELAEASLKVQEFENANERFKGVIKLLEDDISELRKDNEELTDKLAPKPCDGCIHTDNYRKCASCARYPKIKDKYEER